MKIQAKKIVGQKLAATGELNLFWLINPFKTNEIFHKK